MRIGILIIFFNNEKEISNHLLTSLLSIPKNIRLSLVNNGSKDNTLEKLQELEQILDLDLSLLDIKINKGKEAAIKAGARYLSKKDNLKYIGYLNLESVFCLHEFSEIMLLIKEKQDLIAPYNIEMIKRKPSQRMLLKKIFSIHDWVQYSK